MRGGQVIAGSLVTQRVPDGHVCPQQLKRFVIVVAVLGSSLSYIDETIVTVAIAPIRDALGASFPAMQWVVNAYTLVLAAFLLIGGAAGDRYGRRRVFETGIVIFALGSIGCGLAPAVEILVACRIVQGFGAALMVPGSLALIAVNFPESERGRAVGIWAAASGITAAIGPLLGGLLIDAGSWRAIFYLNVPVAIVTIWLLRSRVPADRPRPGAGGFDLVGAGTAFAGVGLFAVGLTVAQQRGLATVGPLAMVAAGLCLCGAFVAWEARARFPMMPLGLFRSRLFSVANAETLLIYFALGGALFFLPITMMEAHGWSAVKAGSSFLPFTLVIAVVAPIAGRAVDGVGVRVPLVAGPIIVALAFGILPIAVSSGSFWTGVVPVMMLLGIGMGIVIPPLSAAVLQGVGESRSGIASGVNNAVASGAALLAVASLGLAASIVFRAELAAWTSVPATAIDGLGFAAPFPPEAVIGSDGAIESARAAAILVTFRVLSLACAATCLAAALLAAIGLPPARRAPLESGRVAADRNVGAI